MTRKIIEKVKFVLIIFMLIIFINICYLKIVRKEKLIQILGKSFLIVTTGSMEPTIKSGELIIISEKNKYKKGAIITYLTDDNYLITHRIVKIDEENFICKGDANNLEDEVNSANNIKGEVIFHSRILGFFVIYILKPLIFIYIILFITTNFIFFKENNKQNSSENVESEEKK